MFKHALSTTVLLLGMALSATGAHAVMIATEDGVEAGHVELVLDRKLTGFVIAEKCAQCPLRLTVDRDTKAYIGSKPVSLEKARRKSGKPATVIYNIKSGKATRIQW